MGDYMKAKAKALADGLLLALPYTEQVDAQHDCLSVWLSDEAPREMRAAVMALEHGWHDGREEGEENYLGFFT